MNPNQNMDDENIAPGTMIGDYRVEGTLAEGGMGLIYEGVHPVISKRVAIKVISKQFAENPKAVSRFIMEARSVNQIGHHNIVDIFSIGELEDGRTYLIMELLEGLSLHDLLMKAKSLPPGKVLPIYEQLCDTMDVIHRKGFVHRDLKPPNIFVLERPPHPFVKILDFGLAKLWSKHTSKVTEVGMVLGTPEYMSPEQCRGKELDFRTDIYSLGVMLYELTTGEQPFSDPSPFEVLTCHLTKEPRRPSEMASMSSSLEWVILKAMAKDPSQRFSSAEEMLEHLRLAIPQRLIWQSHLDFHDVPPLPNDPLSPVHTGPLVLPPEDLDIFVPEEEDYAPEPVPTAHDFIDDDVDTQVAGSGIRRISTSDRGLDLLEIDEEAATALVSPRHVEDPNEVDLGVLDTFEDPVTPLQELGEEDTVLGGPASGAPSPSLELMEVNIDSEETAALPDAGFIQELGNDGFGEEISTPGPEPILELKQVDVDPGSDFIELKNVKHSAPGTIPGIAPGTADGAGTELDLDCEGETMMGPSEFAPEVNQTPVVIRSRKPGEAVGKPSTSEWAAYEDTEIKTEPSPSLFPEKKLPPLPDKGNK